jgi:hypothetical protein
MKLALNPFFYGCMSECSNIIVRPDSSDPASLAGLFEKPKPDMFAPVKPTPLFFSFRNPSADASFLASIIWRPENGLFQPVQYMTGGRLGVPQNSKR